MKYWRLLVLACSVFAAGAASVSAQTNNKIAVGLNFGTHTAGAAGMHGTQGPGLLWRLGHDKTGWGWQWGFNWFSADIDRPIGDRQVELGELRIRPFMGGYGYTRVIGPVSITADLMGGYAINSLSISPVASDAYRDHLGARFISGDATNTLVARPEIYMWIDATRKVGINISTGYMVARPKTIVRSSLGEEVQRVRADMFTLNVGLVYSIR